MHTLFKFREQATPEILALLESVTLGTNGAHYRHLDTRERIKTADHPLFLSMERNDTVMGNITFCRRDKDWYIRYFAFANQLQGTGKKRSKGGARSLLKRELETFFQEKMDSGEVSSFYAYIDPNNEKSLWMSENFGFQTIGTIATQTFSRVRPKASTRVKRIDDWNLVAKLVRAHYGDQQYYFEAQTNKPPFYVLEDDQGEILAMAKINTANWVIERLPGKWGGILTKMIPWIPSLRKIIRPNRHRFIVPEAVVVTNNDPSLCNELFEAILVAENAHLIIWWTDVNNPVYAQIKEQMKWGILDKLVGVNTAHLVSKSNGATSNQQTPFYTTGFDFI